MKFKQIRAGSYSPEEIEVIQSYVNSICPPHISVEVVDIKGPPSPPDFKTPSWVKAPSDWRTVALVAPLMIARAEEAEREGCDAVIFSCVWDPGIFSAKSALRIPVIGMTEAMYRVASLLADRWGLITGIPPLKALIRKGIQAYGVADHVASLKTFDVYPQEFRTRRAEIEAKFIKLAKEQISEGAELIINVCSPLFPSLGREALKRIREQLGVIVIDPIETVLRMTETLVNLGLAQSKITYPLTSLPP